MKAKFLPYLFSVTLFVITSQAIKAQTVPTANFSISPTPVCSGGSYTITDLSTGLPTAWSYTVRTGGGPGGGQATTYTVQNPVVTFNTPGTVTISLVSSNAGGSSSVHSATVQVANGPNANIAPNNPNTCIGGSPLNLSVTAPGPAAAGLTYSWSTGATSSVIAVSPSVSTLYSCIITSTNGCSITRTTNVAVTTPTASIVSVPASICPGTTSTLTATISGQGPYTYNWSNNSTLSTTTSSVTGFFTATLTNAQGCSAVTSYTLGSSSTLTLTTVSTPTAICSGNNGVLTVSGASSYTWNTGSNASSITISPTSNTTYSVTGTIGTCSGTAAITVSVSTIPTVVVSSNPASGICAGGSVTLSASGANAYTWTPGGLNTNVIVVTPSNTTIYTARGQNPGCPARNTTISISVNAQPNINITTSATGSVCAGEAVALSATGANTYSWNTGSTTGLTIVYPGTNTAYTVTGTSSAGCTATATANVLVTDCTGLSEITGNSSFQVFPNPSAGEVNLISGNNTELLITNSIGQTVTKVELNNTNGRHVTLSGLARGLYFISGHNNTVCRKLIVQ